MPRWHSSVLILEGLPCHFCLFCCLFELTAREMQAVIQAGEELIFICVILKSNPSGYLPVASGSIVVRQGVQCVTYRDPKLCRYLSEKKIYAAFFFFKCRYPEIKLYSALLSLISVLEQCSEKFSICILFEQMLCRHFQSSASTVATPTTYVTMSRTRAATTLCNCEANMQRMCSSRPTASCQKCN